MREGIYICPCLKVPFFGLFPSFGQRNSPKWSNCNRGCSTKSQFLVFLDQFGPFLTIFTNSDNIGNFWLNFGPFLWPKEGTNPKKVLLSRGRVPKRRNTERGHANALLASLGHALSHTKIVLCLLSCQVHIAVSI